MSSRWLIWKESCQLVPLIAALVMIVGILWTIQSSMWDVRTDAYYVQLEWVFLILPIVFATGVGTILVGAEREQGTIRWLSMLPITSRRIIATKTLVASFGLMLMWLTAGILIQLFGIERAFASRIALDDPSVELDGVHWIVWIARSVFVLVVSFYAAWKIRNPLIGLVMLVAIMFVPSLIVWMFLSGTRIEIWNGQWREVRLTLTAILISTIWFAYAGYRNGLRALSPDPATTWRPTDILRWIGETFSGNRAYTFQNSFAALLWHSLRNMFWVWAIHLFLLAWAIFGMWLMRDSDYHWQSSPAFPALLAILIASWSAVSVFKFSGTPESVRPLALIGVSPMRVYLARHAIPVSILAFGIVAYTLLATLKMQITNGQFREASWLLPSPLRVSVYVGLVYAISQWISQCFRTTVLAYFTAPLISFAVLQLFDQSSVSLTTMFVWAVVLLSVTAWLMRRYMLGSDRNRAVASAVVIGAMFYLAVLMPRTNHSFVIESPELTNLISTGEGSSEPVTLEIKSSSLDWNEVLTRPDRERDERQRELMRLNLKQQYVSSIELFENARETVEMPGSIAQLNTPALGDLFDALMFERLKYRKEHDDAFLKSIRDTAGIVAALRRSDRWVDQESADRLEIFIADTLGDPELAIDPTHPGITAALQALPTIAGRNEARRAAIVASFREYIAKPAVDANTLIGGLSIDAKEHSFAAVRSKMSHRERVRCIVEASLAAIAHPSQPGTVAAWQTTMHEQTVYAAVPFEWGPYSDWHRHQVPTIITIPPGWWNGSMYPARYFGLPWEKRIQELRAAIIASDI